jgi:sterol desaturase/sphingolipid hydroxylase (fatty acid hydroxylase superfamily)
MAAGGIAASVLAERWAALLAAHSEHDLLVYGLFGVVVAVYWGFGLLCLALDAGQRPASLWATKLQPGRTLTGHPGDVRTPPLGRLVVVVAFNQLAVLLPYSMAQHAIHASPRVQCLALRVDAELPGLAEVVLHVLALALWEEVGFYYSHRLLHTPWLYRAVHSKHHDFHAPTALATIYAHPLEVGERRHAVAAARRQNR